MRPADSGDLERKGRLRTGFRGSMRVRGPDRVYGWLSAALAYSSLWTAAAWFVVLYAAAGLLFGCAYWAGREGFFAPPKAPQTPLDALYFSFITQLTVGYGDISPRGWARVLAPLQGIVGMTLAGVLTGAVVVKWLTNADPGSTRLAQWAGYSLADKCFFVLFANRNAEHLVNCSVSTSITVGGEEVPSTTANPPCIDRSVRVLRIHSPQVQTPVPFTGSDDGLSISVSGTAGMSRCICWRRYRRDQIYVTPDLQHYDTPEFRHQQFTQELWRVFETAPDNAPAYP